MNRLVPILALLLACAGCGRAPPREPVAVEDAVVTLPVLSGRPGAAYFTLRSHAGPARLTEIASPRIGRIALHETVTANGVATMRPIGDATVSPGAPLAFGPGGRHAMLFDVDPALRPGDRVSLTFRFAPGPPVTVEAEVRAAGQIHAGP